MKKIFSILFLLAFTMSSVVSFASTDVNEDGYSTEITKDLSIQADGAVFTYSIASVGLFEPIVFKLKSINLQVVSHANYREMKLRGYSYNLIRPPSKCFFE